MTLQKDTPSSRPSRAPEVSIIAHGGEPVSVRVRSVSPRELVMEVDVPRGYFRGVLHTRRGQFPMETVRIPLLEWPTLQRAPCGPFDIDHTTNLMVVPCYHVQVDDQPAGLAWFDLPSTEMEEQRYFETDFGFAVSAPGRHTLRLAFREDETRIGWDGVERLTLAPDARQPRACPVREDAGLWADEALWAAIAARPTPLQSVMRDSLRHTARSGMAGTYTYRILTLAILYRLGEPEWADELRRLVIALLDRPHWGFHTVEGELGCDNDRDAALRLMQVSAAYAWAPDAFPADLRSRMRDKILRHARILHRFTIVQTAYWPDTTIEAHGLGGWLGLATAAVALYRETPEAREWLDWCYGNFLRNARLLPRDGYNPWPVFNPHWAVYLLALFEHLAGVRLLDDIPFFAHFGPLLRDLLRAGFLPPLTETGGGGLREEIPMLAYLGERTHDDGLQACAATMIRELAAAGSHLTPLTLLWAAGDPPNPPPIPPPPRTLHTRSGHVATFDTVAGRRLRLEFTCGTPQGPENAARLNPYMQFHNHMGFTGNYTLALDGAAVVAGPPGSYDYRTDLFQLVSVNGGGHIMEHRYGGFRLTPAQLPAIRILHDANGLLYVQADLRPAYRADLPLTRAVRHLCLVRGQGIVVVVDDFEAAAPLTFSHHLTTPGTIEAAGSACWRIKAGGAELALMTHMPDGAAAVTSELVYVPTYPMGLNGYKSRDWQPEVHAMSKHPPHYRHLAHTLATPAPAFFGGVVYASRPLDLRWSRPGPAAFRAVLGTAGTLDVDTVNGIMQWRRPSETTG